MPFEDTLHIFITLRVDAALDLRVYDVAGEPLWSTRVQAWAGKNLVDWSGINANGARCAAGAYVLRLSARGIDGTSDEVWERAVIMR